MTKVEFRSATAKDVELFYEKQPIKTMRGYVAVLDGNPIGIGGVYYDGKMIVAFSEMKVEMRGRKRDIARGIRLLTAMYDKIGTVIAVACPTEKTAPKLLEKLGFVPSGQSGPFGDILVRGR